MSFKQLNKVGVAGLSIALLTGIALSTSIELGIIMDTDFIFSILVFFANIALFVFAAVGVYFWLKFMSVAMSHSTFMGKGLYLGCHIFSGYWAYARYKGEACE